MKKKILALCDSPLGVSGVGVQAKFLFEGLLKTGKYSFRVLGGALKHSNYDTIVLSEDYIVKPVDGFGTREQVKQILLTEQPDAVFIFTDPRQFIWLWEVSDEIHQVCPIVYWHVWDNDPYPTFNATWYESTDLINCLSYKTYEMVQPHFPDKTNYIPHTFPKQIYYPLEQTKINSIKQEFFGDKKDWFKILWVNRNAHRKMPNDLLVSFKAFLENLEKEEGHKNALLIMHTNPSDQEGPNLIATTEMLDIKENVWFSVQLVDFFQMNQLINAVDCSVNISRAEGFGLGVLQSLQAGKPVIALKTGGMTRQIIDYRDGTENGVAIEPKERILIGSQVVPFIHEDIVDKKALTEAFMKIYKLTPEEKETLKTKVINYVDHEFNYEKMIANWDVTLEDCINKFKTNKPKQWDVLELGNIEISKQMPKMKINQPKTMKANKKQ